MEYKDYDQFWQKIHQSAREKGVPLRVMFELTYRCNFNCAHCYIPTDFRTKGELTTQEVFSVLDQLKAAGCFYLGFTGGEPFMRADFMDILWYAKRAGFQVIIYTNGSLIDEKKAAALAKFSPNKVDITIPALSKEAFERITGVTGYWDRVFHAIDLLHSLGVPLGFKTCLLRENELEIAQIQEFAASLGSLYRLDTMLSPRLDGDPEPYCYRGTLHLAKSHGMPAISNRMTNFKCQMTNEFQMSNDKLKDKNILFTCGAGRTQAAVTPLGELKLCVIIDRPKITIDTGHMTQDTRENLQITRNTSHVTRNKNEGVSLSEAWEKLKETTENIEAGKKHQCPECELAPYCKWCPAQSWLAHGTFTGCVPESRAWAQMVQESLCSDREKMLKGYQSKAGII
ncbi:MAG: radical SAM protein [Candidatus Omnitrophica bacterium]|nr:radical SAM protein [Candidatus Omnitrophota bacterium]